MVHVDWLNTIGSIDDFRRRFIASSSVILLSVISDIFENMINGEKIKPSEKDSVALKPKTWDPGHTQPFQKLKSTFNFILHTNVTVLLLVCTDILCSKIYNEWSHPATCEGFLFLSFGREKNTFLEEHISRIHSNIYQNSTFQQVSDYDGIKIHSQLLPSKQFNQWIHLSSL